MTTMLTEYDVSTRVTGISQNPYKAAAERLFKKIGRERISCFLVPDPENKYDPNAVQIMVQTGVGRECIGYAEARRYCPLCDDPMRDRGHQAYANEKSAAVCACPKCGGELTLAKSEQMAPLLMLPNVEVSATLQFIGAEGAKANLGAIVYAKFAVPTG